MKVFQGIISANGGNTPRAANTITYSIKVDWGGDRGVVAYTGIKPNGQRPDSTVVDAIPRPVGYPFFVTEEVEGGAVVVHFEETPAYGPCPGSLGTQARDQKNVGLLNKIAAFLGLGGA